MIKLYAHRRCKMVRTTQRCLDLHGVEYEYIDVDKNKDAQAFVMEHAGGFLSVPTLLFPDGKVMIEPTFGELNRKLKSIK